MYKDIAKAIKSGREVILSLVDGSKISGVPSWGENRNRVKVISPGRVVWVPIDEIEHVTNLLSINDKKPTDLIG